MRRSRTCQTDNRQDNDTNTKNNNKNNDTAVHDTSTQRKKLRRRFFRWGRGRWVTPKSTTTNTTRQNTTTPTGNTSTRRSSETNHDRTTSNEPNNKGESSVDPKDSTDDHNPSDTSIDDDDDDDTNDKDSSLFFCSPIKSVAMWRMLFFTLMMYEWCHAAVLIPFTEPLDLTVGMGGSGGGGANNHNVSSNGAIPQVGRDRWFGYDHLDWVQDLHWKLSSRMDHDDFTLGQYLQTGPLLQAIGFVTCFLAAFGKELNVPAWRGIAAIFTSLYAIRFWAKGTTFTNHNYLFPLLMVLTIISGGGHISGRVEQRGRVAEKDKDTEHRNATVLATRAASQTCEAVIVAFRAEFCLLYFFASYWKFHPDWLQGRICAGIFLGLEQSSNSRGISWSYLQNVFPPLFVVLAVSGLILDSSMFATLAFSRPRPAITRIFLAFTLLFHVFTSSTMAQLIGYTFPGTCMAGLVLFLPMYQENMGDSDKKEEIMVKQAFHYDRSLVQWLKVYWKIAVTGRNLSNSTPKSMQKVAKDQQYTPPSVWIIRLVVLWCLWQFLFPLRMLYVSGLNFPYNRLGYRYSWTMMLHATENLMVRKEENGQPTALQLAYIVPTCFRDKSSPLPDAYMPRTAYYPQSNHPMEDPRTVPMHQIMGNREYAMLNVFPVHFLPRIAYGFARVLDQMAGTMACADQGVTNQDRMGMHAVYFSQLNSHGPFCRVFDPTIDLVSVVEAKHAKSYPKIIWDALWDRRPEGYEFVLYGVGTLRDYGVRKQRDYRERYPGKTVQTLADRSACLSRRPLWFRPVGNPYLIIPVLLPRGSKLEIRALLPPTEGRQPDQWKTTHLEQGRPELVHTIAFEVGIVSSTTGGPWSSPLQCGETTGEDMLVAFVY